MASKKYEFNDNNGIDALPNALWPQPFNSYDNPRTVVSFGLSTSWEHGRVVFPGPLWLVLHNV